MSCRTCGLVAILSLIATDARAIVVYNGEHLKESLYGGTDSAGVVDFLARLVTEEENGTQIQGDPNENGRIRIVPGSATLTAQPTTPGPMLVAAGMFIRGNRAGDVLARDGTTLVPTVGGIGIEQGVILTTGRASDVDGIGELIDPAKTWGAHGPNDAISKTGHRYDSADRRWYEDLQTNPNIVLDSGDDDLNADAAIEMEPFNSWDACALEFDIQIKQKGKLQFQFVLATDEFPEWISQFDDVFGVYITGGNIPSNDLDRNIAKIPIVVDGVKQRRLFSINLIEPVVPLVIENKGVFDPDDSPPPNQMDPNAQYHNHEYDLFTKVLTRESVFVLEPGTFHVKLVIHDVGDAQLDSAVFFKTASFKLNPCVMQAGEYNGNGLVEHADLGLVLNNWGQSYQDLPATWIVHPARSTETSIRRNWMRSCPTGATRRRSTKPTSTATAASTSATRRSSTSGSASSSGSTRILCNKRAGVPQSSKGRQRRRRRRSARPQLLQPGDDRSGLRHLLRRRRARHG